MICIAIFPYLHFWPSFCLIYVSVHTLMEGTFFMPLQKSLGGQIYLFYFLESCRLSSGRHKRAISYIICRNGSIKWAKKTLDPRRIYDTIFFSPGPPRLSCEPSARMLAISTTTVVFLFLCVRFDKRIIFHSQYLRGWVRQCQV